ncbi:MAG: TetR family transcriptional regulator [Alphaproteobacteria bacterium]|nr:TetR family transcriptional regulator [Alphaproteobacteria bacterium]
MRHPWELFRRVRARAAWLRHRQRGKAASAEASGGYPEFHDPLSRLSRYRLARKSQSTSRRQGEPEGDTEPSTRDRIIDAAELLFAQQGYEGTTTRAIALKGDVPLGLMSYYFGTKADLYSEVVKRRSAEHAADLGRALQEVRDRPDQENVTIADLIDAFFLPVVHRAMDCGPGWRAYVKLLSLAANTPGSEPHTKSFAREYAAVVEEFIDLLKRKLPGAREEDVYWAFYILNSAIIHILVENESIDRLSRGRCKASDLRTVAGKLAALFDAGMAPLAAGSR